MKTFKTTRRLIAGALAIAGSFVLGHSACAQALYVGDGHNDTVEAIEVASGTFVGPFIHSSDDAGDYKITGPRGVIFTGSACLVINQNVGLPINGDHSFSGLPRTGKPVKEGLYLSFRQTNPATLVYQP